MGSQEIKFDNSEQINILLKNIKIFGKIFVVKEGFFDSSIVNNDIKKLSICNWIKQKINKNQIKFEKLFTMSINGSSPNDFHQYCDNKGPTLTLIKTSKNKIFGGFIPLNWESGEDLLKLDGNNQTFIFSLDLMKKFDMLNKEKAAIYCDKLKGPIFGASDINIQSNMKKCVTYANKYTNFLANNFEVFKIIY